jgi:hypothetical protein
LGWGAGLGAGGCELGGRGIHRLQAGMGAAHGHSGESCLVARRLWKSDPTRLARVDPALVRGTAGYGRVPLPHALGRMDPHAPAK